MNNIAPIVLFVYNRITHAQETIKALQSNALSIRSDLIIYSDGYKNNTDKSNILELRDYLKNIKGFKNITIVEQSKNIGLAKSIIEGVTEIVNKYGRVIVVEDDIVTSPYFLTFMNNALNYYMDNKKVWHISGWNYPLDTNNLYETFLWRMMNCWGWATWKDRWEYYEKEPQKVINLFSKYDIYKFDLDGLDGFWSQVVKNNNNTMNTWAIFWYATIFNNNGLCLNPVQSYVHNIGFDGSGTNTGLRDNYESILSNKSNIQFTDKLKENDLALYKIRQFLIKQKSPNLTFSKNINLIYANIKKLNKNEQYIIYGAGSGSILMLDLLKDNIEYIMDNNNNLNNTTYYGKNVYLPRHTTLKIIISVFGREQTIKNMLIENYNINPNSIITFNLN